MSLPCCDDGRVVQEFCDIFESHNEQEYRGRINEILGVESQARIHYAMPVKVMPYDIMNYAAQISAIKKVVYKEIGTNINAKYY